MHILTDYHTVLYAAGLCCLSGCVTPWNTQLPTPYSGPPVVENRRNERFDPFARSDLGPDTLSRPREYSDPRSGPRQTRDAVMNQSPAIQGIPNPLDAPAPAYPTQRYPGVVPF